MGRFVNPGNSAFKVALASEIYIDKTNLLDFTNSVLGTKQAYICNSRPRRFGKSITADMLTAYYSKGCDSRELFMNYNIAQTEDFEKYLNKYDVIHLDMQWILMDAGAPERISGYINKNVISELADLYKDIDLRNQKTLYGALSVINSMTNNKFVIIIDEWDVLIRDEAANSSVQEEYINFLRGMFKGSEPTKYIGANMGTAMEGALKVGETIQVPGIAYELEEYIHGPNLQLTPNYTVFFIDGGLASDRTQEIFEATGVITDKTYMLTNKKGLEGKNIINPDFEINELITPLAFLPFFQILSYQITEDTHKWKKHPLMDEMKRLAGAKTLNYESSPLRKDMPQ